MGIKDFVNVKENKVEIYEKAIHSGATEEEKRELEMQLLKPQKIPKYIGKPPDPKSAIEKRTIKLILPDFKTFELLKKHFNVRTYTESCIADLDLFILFLKALESGEITYNKKENELTYT
jgi:hypothetical protein